VSAELIRGADQPQRGERGPVALGLVQVLVPGLALGVGDLDDEVHQAAVDGQHAVSLLVARHRARLRAGRGVLVAQARSDVLHQRVHLLLECPALQRRQLRGRARSLRRSVRGPHRHRQLFDLRLEIPVVALQGLAEVTLLPGELGVVLGYRRRRVRRVELPSDPVDQVGGLLRGPVVELPAEPVQHRRQLAEQLRVLAAEQAANLVDQGLASTLDVFREALPGRHSGIRDGLLRLRRGPLHRRSRR
jgi:hypothetical protein